MAASLEELIEEWDKRTNSDSVDLQVFWVIRRCIKDLRDTMLVMQAEQVRKEKL